MIPRVTGCDSRRVSRSLHHWESKCSGGGRCVLSKDKTSKSTARKNEQAIKYVEKKRLRNIINQRSVMGHLNNHHVNDRLARQVVKPEHLFVRLPRGLGLRLNPKIIKSRHRLRARFRSILAMTALQRWSDSHVQGALNTTTRAEEARRASK